MLLRKSAFAAILAGVGLTSSAFAGITTVDNLTSWNGTDAISEFGVPDTSTYGQTFVTPNATDTMLHTYEFKLHEIEGGIQDFNFYIMAWDGAKATGSVLYKSDSMFILPTGRDYVDYVAAPELNLIDGQQYVAFISTVESNRSLGTNLAEQAFQTNGSGDSYTGGAFVYLNTFEGNWTTDNWNTTFAFGDTAFKAVFCNPVPEPASMAVLGMGAIALIRRRKKA